MSAYFTYYFLDENCSTYSLRVLEVVRPSLNFKTKNDLFVVPQETLKEVKEKMKVKDIQFLPSIKRKLIAQFEILPKAEKEKTIGAKSSLETLKSLKQTNSLDLMIDYFKMRNYQENTHLDRDEKELMVTSLQRRASIQKTSSPLNKNFHNEKLEPHKGHSLRKVSLVLGDGIEKASFRYGFHSFGDPLEGSDPSSYISFLNLNYNKFDDEDLYHFNIVDILSLQNFNAFFKNFSWRVGLNHFKWIDEDFSELNGAGGLSWVNDQYTFYVLAAFHAQKGDYVSRIEPATHLGLRYNLKNNLSFIYELRSNFNNDNYLEYSNFEIKSFQKKYNLSLYFESYQFFDNLGLKLETLF